MVKSPNLSNPARLPVLPQGDAESEAGRVGSARKKLPRSGEIGSDTGTEQLPDGRHNLSSTQRRVTMISRHELGAEPRESFLADLIEACRV